MRKRKQIAKECFFAIQSSKISLFSILLILLGAISLPEAIESLDYLIEATKDSDSNVRARCAWAIGRLGPSAGPKAIKPLIELIKDNYWKVKTSACIAIGCLGQQSATQALPLLLKVSLYMHI